jgi:hypothetical protein
VSDDITEDDMRAMRQQGDRSTFLRSLIKPTRTGQVPAPPPTRHEPDHRPGTWPAGTQPPGPLPAQPPGAWDTAVEEFRALNRRRPGYLYALQRCECGCDPEAKDT